MEKKYFFEALDRYASGKSTEKEKRLMATFFDILEKKNAAKTNGVFVDEVLKEQLYKNIATKTGIIQKGEKDKRRKYYLNPLRFAAAAAMILLALLLWPQVLPRQASYITKSTERGQKLSMTLPDGSQVYLNAESKISFPESFGKNNRTVLLEGEAFFEVARIKNLPFEVITSHIKTTVLGTSFNVRSYPDDDTELTVATGKVHIQSLEPEMDLVLQKHQQLFFTPTSGKFEQREVDAENFVLWKDNIIRLDDTTLPELVKLLERWYDLTISFENVEVSDCRISGKYKADRIEHLLDGLQFVTGIEFRFEGSKKIILQGSLCNTK